MLNREEENMVRAELTEGRTRRGPSLRGMVAGSLLALTALLGTTTATLAQDRDITIVLQEEPFSVEPCDANTSIIGKVLKQNIVETLTDRDPTTGEILPRLATSWEHPDDLTWLFHIRQGVKFHDGADLNADAVIHAINRTLDTRINCEVRIKVFGGFTMQLSAPDPYTVKIVTDKPQPILPTMIVPVTIMSPNTPDGVMTDHPIGTGPYEFVSRTPGEEIDLKRFDGYWGDKPQVENVRYVWRSESSVRAAMVATGEADLAPNIAVDDATDSATDFPYPNSETTRLRIQVDQPPFDDRRVREALNFAVDRDALRGTLFPKDAIPATQLVPPGTVGYNADLQVWPYDPDKARQLLAEAKADGVPVDKEFTIYGRMGVYPHSTESLEAILGMLKDVGFNANLQMLEVAQHVIYLQKPYPEQISDHPNLIQDQHDNGNGDAVFTVLYKYGSTGANSVLHNDELDKTIDAASQATGKERVKLWNRAFEIIEHDVIADVMLFHMVGYARVNPRISYEPSIKTNSEVEIQTITFND
jgi:peptide/nickel transport system substrate-binding protein